MSTQLVRLIQTEEIDHRFKQYEQKDGKSIEYTRESGILPFFQIRVASLKTSQVLE
jgi:hypothetical protein